MRAAGAMSGGENGADEGLRFSVLGPLRVERDGAAVRLGGQQQRAVLAALLIRHPATLTVHQLADDLWSGQPRAGYATTVQSYVHRLRQALDPAHSAEPDRPWRVIERSNGGYRLALGDGSLDVERFRNHVRHGQALLAAGDHAAAHDELACADALWRGDALADLADYPFVSAWAAHLHELRVGAVEDDLDARLVLGEHASLVAQLDELVTAKPERERLQAQRMLALYRGGRQADALAAYRALRRYLDQELGVRPSAAVEELHRAILRQDPALVPPPHVAVGAGAVPFPRREVEPTRPASARISRRRVARRVVAVAAVAVAAASAIAAVVVPRSADHSRPQLRALPANAVGIVAADGALLAGPEVGSDPSAIAVGAGSVWVASNSTRQVVRIDPHTRQIVDRITVGRTPAAIAFTPGAAWVANAGDGTVSRIDVASGNVVQTIRVGAVPVAIAAGPSGVWVADSGDDAVQRIDPDSGAAGAPIDVGGGPDGIVVTDSAVWVANAADATLTELDPATRRVLAGAVPVGSGPGAMAVSGTTLWVADESEGAVDRIDTRTARVVAHLGVGDGSAAVALVGPRVWVANRYDGTISVIDAGSNTVRHRYSIGASPRGVAGVGGTVWIAVAPLRATGHAGGTLTIAQNPSVPGDALGVDPAKMFLRSDIVRALRLVYDGLVTYRTAGGSSGASLVPDLAEAVPRPSDGGRTYAFTVRAGIRFSDGSPVRASDIARGVLRNLTITPSSPLQSAGLLGADACADQPRRCDLRRAVVADDARRSIVFHLRAPDPNFLYKLIYASQATPRSAPPAESKAPLSGTGPYRIVQHVEGRLLLLGRNKLFRQWSYAAQPAGYPDEIRWVPVATSANSVRGALTGRLDVATVRSDVQNSQLALGTVLSHVPAQVHSQTRFGLQWFFLNTRVPPFDDIRVRRAVNYALDRRAVVALTGGSDQPTCQTLPPNFPGYAAHCPYSTGPADTTYAGPDLVAARRLVAASHTRGLHVTLLCRKGASIDSVWEFVAGVLRSLGYRVTIKLLDETPFFAHLLSGQFIDRQRFAPRPWQIIYGSGWVADFPAASNFYFNIFGCDVDLAPRGHFCDRALEATARQAAGLEQTDPARSRQLWQQVDRALTDQAAFLPLKNDFEVVITSTRVHNFQSGPFTGPLLDQLWVR